MQKQSNWSAHGRRWSGFVWIGVGLSEVERGFLKRSEFVLKWSGLYSDGGNRGGAKKVFTILSKSAILKPSTLPPNGVKPGENKKTRHPPMRQHRRTASVPNHQHSSESCAVLNIINDLFIQRKSRVVWVGPRSVGKCGCCAYDETVKFIGCG